MFRGRVKNARVANGGKRPTDDGAAGKNTALWFFFAHGGRASSTKHAHAPARKGRSVEGRILRETAASEDFSTGG